MYRKTFIFCFLLVSIILFINSSKFDNSTIISTPDNIQIILNPCVGSDTIKITLVDSLHIVSAKLFWKKNSNPWDSLNLSHIGGYWIGIIYLTGPANYNYYIKTLDTLNRVGTMPAGAPANYYTFIVGPDTTKPVITHTPLVNTPKANWPATINIVATDNCGIDSVWVRWRINSGNYKLFKLINTSLYYYSASFNSTQSEVNIGDTIRYRIIAQDISSYHNKDSTALYSFKIIQSIGINSNAGAVPERYYLYQNYPNPFNPITKMTFDIPKLGLVSLKVFDVLGREVKVILNEIKSPGSYSIDFDASELSSGVYFYRLESKEFTDVKRMILIK